MSARRRRHHTLRHNRNAKVRFWHDDYDSTYENKLRMATYNDDTLHATLDSLTAFSGPLTTTSAMSTIACINQMFPLLTNNIDTLLRIRGKALPDPCTRP